MKERLTWGFLQFGKRFALNSAGTFSYKPRVVYYTRGQGDNDFQVDAVNFSYLF